MATPREQHGARPGAHVLGSGHQDGRQPLVESRDDAVEHALGTDRDGTTERETAERREEGERADEV